MAGVAVALAFATFNYWFLPNIDHYRPFLANTIGEKIGRKVTIQQLSGVWEGVAPRLVLKGLRIDNPHDGVALTLDAVSVVPSWLSLMAVEPRFSSIAINTPSIELLRSRDGQIYLNGFALTSSTPSHTQSDSGSVNWLLRQSHIEINNANFSWQDDFIGLPQLNLKQVNVLLGNGLLHHVFRLSGVPVSSLGKGFDMEALWRGDDMRQWKAWSGTVRVSLDGAKVGAWSRYLEKAGLIKSGEGNGDVELAFSRGRVDSLMANVSVRNAAYTPPDSRELVLPQIQGKLALTRQQDDSYLINATDLTLASATGLAFDHSSINGQWALGADGKGELTLDNVNVLHLTPFIHALGVDRNPLFARFAPSGSLHDLTVNWTGSLDAPRQFAMKTDFRDLAWLPFGSVPGVAGVAGSISFNEKGGRLQITGGQPQVRFPSLFDHSLVFGKLDADVSWAQSAKGLDVKLSKVDFANNDLSGTLGGNYNYTGSGAGNIDITASLDKVAARKVADYLPHQVGQDTLKWLRFAIEDGQVDKTSLILKGNLDQFPFVGGKGGAFLVSSDISKARLRYEKGWPTLDNIDAKLIFHNEKMQVEGHKVSTLGVPLQQVNVGIDNLGANVPHLSVHGKANDQLTRMLAFTTKSPIDKWLGGFTGQIQGQGSAGLDLSLLIPLSGPDPVKVRGEITFPGNQVVMKNLPLPALNGVKGKLIFTENGVESPGLAMQAWDGHFVMTASTGQANRIKFDIQGDADSHKLINDYVPLLAPYVSGRSKYAVQFFIKNDLENLTVNSSLQGTTFSAPVPLNKQAEQSWPLQLTLAPGKAQTRGMLLDFTVAGLTTGRFRLSDKGVLQAGMVSYGKVAELPASGLVVKVAMPTVDLNQWQAVLEKGAANVSAAGASFGYANAVQPFVLEVDSPLVNGWGQSWHQVSAKLSEIPNIATWALQLRSTEMSGLVEYQPKDQGRVTAHFSKVVIPAQVRADKHMTVSSLTKGSDVRNWPEMNVIIDDLIFDGRSIGHWDMLAKREGRSWVIDPLAMSVPEGKLRGAVTVTDNEQGQESVTSTFKVSTTDVGRLLARFGQGDTFRKGEGSLSGSLAWPGRLIDIDLANVSGQLSLELKNGQFAKVNPGVAKLLGVLSLQSIPRRIRLDFTDVFSDGFAFDLLAGDAKAVNGVFETHNVEMKGPAASVKLSGKVNLQDETQNMRVHVEPHLAESVALAAGAVLVNPVVGVAALAAQKVLQDPVGKIFSVDYAVTGSLKSPQVEKQVVTPVQAVKRISQP